MLLLVSGKCRSSVPYLGAATPPKMGTTKVFTHFQARRILYEEQNGSPQSVQQEETTTAQVQRQGSALTISSHLTIIRQRLIRSEDGTCEGALFQLFFKQAKTTLQQPMTLMLVFLRRKSVGQILPHLQVRIWKKSCTTQILIRPLKLTI